MHPTTTTEVSQITQQAWRNSILGLVLAFVTLGASLYLLTSASQGSRAIVEFQRAFLLSETLHEQKVAAIWRFAATKDVSVGIQVDYLESQRVKALEPLDGAAVEYDFVRSLSKLKADLQPVVDIEGVALQRAYNGDYPEVAETLTSLAYRQAKGVAAAERREFAETLRSRMVERVMHRLFMLYTCLGLGGVLVVAIVFTSWRAVQTMRRHHGLLESTSDELRQLNQSLESRVEERTRELAAQAETLRLARDEAEAGNRAKDRFLGALSHELRTPLNGVIGMLHLVRQSSVKGTPQESYAGEALDSAEFLQSIVERAFDTVRLQSGSLIIKPEAFDLVQTITSTLHWHETKANAKGLDLTHETPAETVVADATRFRQIVSNLTDNAIKYTAAGSIRVVSRLVWNGPDAGDLTVEVIDTGPGLSAEAAARVFDRFYRVDDSNTRKADGLGLGLALCRDLAHAMGGELTVSSTPGVGSTFTLSIPVRAAEDEPRTTVEAEATGLEDDGLRVLVVDDNATNRRVLRAFLAGAGAHITDAADGAEACALCSVAAYDLILMDMQMPVMDGLEATRTLRGRPGPNRHTPILAVTADARPETALAAREAGMNDIILKPLRPEAVFTAIAAVLEDAPETAVRLAS